MANSYLNMARTTTLQTLLRRVKALLRLPSNSSGTDFLGSTDEDAAQTFADCINDALVEFLGDFPILDVAEVTLTTTAGDKRTALPATLANAEIYGLTWDYEDRRGQAITLVDMDNMLGLPPALRDGDTSSDPPEYVYLEWPQNGDSGNFVWLPIPALARDFKVLYRANSVQFAGVDVAGAGDGVVPVPDSMIECFAHCVAYRIGERSTGTASVEPNTLQAKYRAQVDVWTDRLASPPYHTLTATSGFTGMPRDVDGNRFRDIMRPRFLR